MPDWLRDLFVGMPSLGTVLAIALPVLGFVLLVAGVRVWWERRGQPEELRPAKRASRSNIGQSLDDLVRLVRDYYKAQGYDVVAGGEPGVDLEELVVLKDAQSTLVRCLPGDEPPPPAMVEALAAARDTLRAQRAVLIAPAGFLSDARRRAVMLGVELRDKSQIELMQRLVERRAN